MAKRQGKDFILCNNNRQKAIESGKIRNGKARPEKKTTNLEVQVEKTQDVMNGCCAN